MNWLSQTFTYEAFLAHLEMINSTLIKMINMINKFTKIIIKILYNKIYYIYSPTGRKRTFPQTYYK
jgi:hypothetical protein